MSDRSNNSESIFAAGQFREFIEGEVEDTPNNLIRRFAGMIDNQATLDRLSYLDSVYADHGQDFQDTRLYEIIARRAATRAADRALKEGEVSQMQGAVGLVRSESDGKEALSRVAQQLANEGAICLTLGPPGAGKTATTLDVARVWAAMTGGSIIGNTEWEGFDEVVHTDREMLEAMGQREGQVLAVIDETAQNLSGYGSASTKAEAFTRRLTFIRKQEGDHGPHAKRGSVMLVSHTRKRTAASLRRVATLAIEKPHRNDPGRMRLLDSEGGVDNFSEMAEFKGLTDTRETYSEHEASHFDIVEEDTDGDGDDAPDADNLQREAAIENALRAAKPWDDDGGLTYSKVAEIVGYSKGWVGERVREWRDGQHRDLVNDPREVTE